MLARFVAGSLMAAVVALPAVAEAMDPEQARQFVANKLFAFTCFDGSRGWGRISSDGSVTGSIQFSGTGPVRYARLPVNTIQVRSNAVCASLKGIPFEPCFNLTKNDEASFRGSISGMGFAYCDFHKHGNSIIMTRAHIRPRLVPPVATRSANSLRTEERAEAKKAEGLDLRPSTD